MSESDIDNAISTISGYVSACMAGIDEGASDYDKAVHFYEYVIEHAEYEEKFSSQPGYVLSSAWKDGLSGLCDDV